MLLQVKKVSKSFGGIRALDGVSLEIKEGTINGLIGPNGSGKTTLFNVISGFCPPDSGKIIFRGNNITNLPPHKIFHEGICRTFQISDIREKMTVLENMLLPQKQVGEQLFEALFKRSKIREMERINVSKSLHTLEILELGAFPNEYGGELSGGQRKLLSSGRILMANPKLFLLDEPTAGVNLTLVPRLLKFINGLKKEGKTFIVVEHKMGIVNKLCEKVFVLSDGKKIAEGTPKQIQKNDKVLEAYLVPRG